MHLQIDHWPHPILSISICSLIYLNFFTHHFTYDIRWVLTVLLIIIFFRTTVKYQLNEKTFKMPMTLAFLLIGFFIWIAENITTFLGAWQYPNQEHSWSVVHIGKISSWFLLVVISIIIVAQLKRVKTHIHSTSAMKSFIRQFKKFTT